MNPNMNFPQAKRVLLSFELISPLHVSLTSRIYLKIDFMYSIQYSQLLVLWRKAIATRVTTTFKKLLRSPSSAEGSKNSIGSSDFVFSEILPSCIS